MMLDSIKIDGYSLVKGNLGAIEYLQFVGETAEQLQVFLAEITRPDGEGEKNLARIRQGITRPGPGIAYERYPLDSRYLEGEPFTNFKLWWESNNKRPLDEPIWTAMVEWEPNVEGFIPHSTLMKILDAQVTLSSGSQGGVS